MTVTVRDLVDELDVLDLADLAGLGAPCVSVYLPTGRTKEDAARAPLELRALLDRARAESADGSADGSTGGDTGADAEPALARLAQLVEHTHFWEHQSEGLALFADADALRAIRLTSDPGRRVGVGPHPHLVPLLDELDHHGPYHLLALGLGGVRLFGGTWSAVEELDLGPIPASVEDMERRHAIEPELQHQHTPAARGTATFHGHGGREVNDVVVEKFVHEVASGVRRRLGAATQIPLYVAAVEDHLPRLRATGLLPTLQERMIPGNPESLSGRDLLDRVRPLVAAAAEERDAETHALLERAAGQALLTTDPEETRRAASEGRVDCLVVDPAHLDGPDAAVDALVVATMHQGGTVRVLDSLPHEARTAAVLRY